MQEEWRPVVGYESRYEISSMGRIKSLLTHKILTLKRDKDGYAIIGLCKGTPPVKQAKVHRLVAEAFIEIAPDNKQVNHKNGVKNDNRVENLEWSTPQKNAEHSFKVLKNKCASGDAHYARRKPEWVLRGSANGSAKLTEEAVIYILHASKQNVSRTSLARKFNISISMISEIVRGKAWKHIPRSK